MGHTLIVGGMVIIVVLALLLLVMPSEARVDDEIVVPMPRETVQRRLFGPLGSLRASRLETASTGQWSVHSSYLPSWALVVAVLLFPVGLVVLLFARRRLVLHVRFLEEQGGGTRVQVAGRARRGVAWDVARAVESIRGATPGVARTRR